MVGFHFAHLPQWKWTTRSWLWGGSSVGSWRQGAAPGVAPVVAAVATTGGSPPSSSLTREALIQRVDDESLGGYGG
jgi:hypothetical protein